MLHKCGLIVMFYVLINRLLEHIFKAPEEVRTDDAGAIKLL